MSNFTVASYGQVNGSGDARAIYLKIFGGEVITAFEEATVSVDKHFVREIPHGKSAQFPMTGQVVASYHTPGAEIAGQAVNGNEKVITVDDLLIAPVFLANVDEALSHFEVRSIYSSEAGRALAYQFDKNVQQCAILGARQTTPLVTGLNAGTSLTSSGTLYKTSATDLAAGIFAARQTLTEKHFPMTEPAWAYMRPAQYYLLAQATNLINKDWGGQGSYADGKITKIADIEFVPSMHFPTTNISSGPSKYQGDFTKSAAVVTTRMSVGTVKLLGLAVESEYSVRHQGTLIVAKYLVGHDWLRADASVELKTTS